MKLSREEKNLLERGLNALAEKNQRDIETFENRSFEEMGNFQTMFANEECYEGWKNERLVSWKEENNQISGLLEKLDNED